MQSRLITNLELIKQSFGQQNKENQTLNLRRTMEQESQGVTA